MVKIPVSASIPVEDALRKVKRLLGEQPAVTVVGPRRKVRAIYRAFRFDEAFVTGDHKAVNPRMLVDQETDDWYLVPAPSWYPLQLDGRGLPV